MLPFSTLRERVLPVSHVRSTLVHATLGALADASLDGEYYQALPREAYDTVRLTPAGSWLTLHEALPHFRACEALGLTPLQATELGVAVAQHTQRMIPTAATRFRAFASPSPWPVFAQFGRYFRRFFLGGELAIFRHGEREGRIELVGLPFATFSHLRHGVRGVVSEAMRGFLGRVLVKEIDRPSLGVSLVLRIAWA